MEINQTYIIEWLTEYNILLQPYFTETLRGYAIPYGKSII